MKAYNFGVVVFIALGVFRISDLMFIRYSEVGITLLRGVARNAMSVHIANRFQAIRPILSPKGDCLEYLENRPGCPLRP